MQNASKKHLLTLTAMVAILALFLGGCVRGTYETDQEPECVPEIVDESYEGPTSLLLGIGDGALTAATLKARYPDDFALFAGVGGPVSTASTSASTS